MPDWMEHKIDARNRPFITTNMQLAVGLKPPSIAATREACR